MGLFFFFFFGPVIFGLCPGYGKLYVVETMDSLLVLQKNIDYFVLAGSQLAESKSQP